MAASWEKTRLRAAIALYVLSEQEAFYRGRELIAPEQPGSARRGSPPSIDDLRNGNLLT
jgi:hypothetical protein